MDKRLDRFAGATVLVVDDNQANVELLEMILNDEGLPGVFTETDPRRVAERLPEIQPDLVLLDLVMPHLDGHAVLAQIVRYAAGTYLPVLVLTSDVSHAARNRALEHGARDFLTKPLDLTETVLRVANLLETRELYVAHRPRHGPPAAPVELDSVERVRAVLADGTITPVYQKIVDTETLEVVGYEALARFPTHHVRGPAGWFGDAFAAGLGVELEWLAVRNALPVIADLAPSRFLSLNMAAATVLTLDHRELCPAEMCPYIVIELTEHVPVEDYRAIANALADLRSRGARLAADDLGSGAAGFRHLLALEPDIIKLDISLVRDLLHSRNAKALASALVAFADDISASVVAEGVEKRDELEAVRDLGIPWTQGYYVGRPEPVI